MHVEILCTGLLAQLVEQQTLNLQVQGSSPWRPTSLRFTELRLKRPAFEEEWLLKPIVQKSTFENICKSGEIGRRTGLRSQPSKEDGGSSPPSCTTISIKTHHFPLAQSPRRLFVIFKTYCKLTSFSCIFQIEIIIIWYGFRRIYVHR